MFNHNAFLIPLWTINLTVKNTSENLSHDFIMSDELMTITVVNTKFTLASASILRWESSSKGP